MQLTIRVGAAADRSLADVYRPLLESGERARTALTRSSTQAARASSAATKKGISEEEREYQKLVKQTEKWRRDEVRAAEKAARDQVKSAEKASRDRENAVAKATKKEASEADKVAAYWQKVRDKSAAYAIKVAEKTASATARAEERTAREKARAAERAMSIYSRSNQDSARDKAATNSALMAGGKSLLAGGARAVGAAGRFAAGVAGGLARGAGVNTDIGSIVAKNFELESQATDLSNAGYMAGDARNGMRVDPNALMAQTLSVGKATGTDANDVMEGLQKFVAKTGDLRTARDVIGDMAVLARTTGANMEDVADAAGDVASALPDTADKGARVKDVMSVIAAQGKVGAVEIKQLATQMTKIAAASGQFEGDAGQNMIAFGAMAQMARSGKGGAASASQAANTVGAFTATFAKGARVDAFNKFGVNIAGEGGKVRDPKAIILDAIAAANSSKFGGPGKANVNMGEMFKDRNARTAVMGFENIYKEAGGGDAGLAAVSAEFDRLVQSTIAEREARDSFAAAMNTSKAKAESFNQSMREVVLNVQQELTPALVALTPYIIAAAQALADAVSWITGKSSVGPQLRVAGQNVAGAIDSTEKGIKTGEIAGGQQALNAQAEESARKAVEAAKADVTKTQEGGLSDVSKSALKLYDMFGPGNLLTTIGSGNVGVGQSVINRDEGKQQDAESRLVAAQEIFKSIHAENQKVADLLANNVIRVRIEGGAAPPGVSDSGRTPPSE